MQERMEDGRSRWENAISREGQENTSGIYTVLLRSLRPIQTATPLCRRRAERAGRLHQYMWAVMTRPKGAMISDQRSRNNQYFFGYCPWRSDEP